MRTGTGTFELRPASQEDYEFLYALVREAMLPYVTALYGWNELLQRERFRTTFTPESWQVVRVAEANAGGLETEWRPGELFIANLHLHPEYRRRGIGKALVQQLLRSAHSDGLAVSLEVWKLNVNAQRLYRRLGFRTINQTAATYRMRCDPR